jgi:hypothetical protein
VIPVFNEEANIERTLQAFASQVDRDGCPLDPDRFEILVLANNCTDRSAMLARQFAAAYPHLHLHVIELVLPRAHAHVGAARRLVMDEACRRLGRLGRSNGVIASTDGDTQVREDWVAANLREVARGADAVGGRIQASADELAGLDAGARRYYTRDLAYRTARAAYECVLAPDPYNPWPRHHHCFGGSLAVTAATYLAAGGIPAIKALEDLAFCRSLARIQARVRHSPEVVVHTSMRCAGRVEIGLSGTLAIWSRAASEGVPWLVESPAAIESSVEQQTLAQALWQKSRRREMLVCGADAFGLDFGWLETARQRATTAGDFWLAIQDRQRELCTGPAALPKMEVRAATAELRERLRAHRVNLRGAARLQAQREREGWSDEAQAEDGLAA